MPGSSGYQIAGAGGTISINNSGTVSTTFGDAIRARSGETSSGSNGTMAPGGDISIKNSGTLSSTGGNAIFANSGQIGTDSQGKLIFAPGGNITIANSGIASGGIYAQMTGDGSVKITNTGQITASGPAIIANSGALWTGTNGTDLMLPGGPVTILNQGTITSQGSQGIAASSFAGTVTVTNDTAGTINMVGGQLTQPYPMPPAQVIQAIQASSSSGNATVVNKGTVNGGDIYAWGGGSASVNNSGTVAGGISASSNGDTGTNTGSPAATIVNSGSVNNTESWVAVNASGSGAASVSVTNQALGTIRSKGAGVNAWTNTGTVTVKNAGTITAGGTGIQAGSSGGDIGLTNTGSVSSTGNSGISAHSGQVFFGVPGSTPVAVAGGNITINNSGSVSGAGNAIFASSGEMWSDQNNNWVTAPGGNITITNSGSAAGGIYASAVSNGSVKITNTGTVTSSGTAIGAQSGVWWTNSPNGSNLSLPGGPVTVLNQGTVMSAGGPGIAASSTSAVTVTNDKAGTIHMNGGRAIDANSWSGDVTVVNKGTVNGGDIGVWAGGSASVNNSGTLTGSISANSNAYGTNTGSPATTIVNSGAVTGASSNGGLIWGSTTGSGSVSIANKAGGTVTAQGRAIASWLDAGSAVIGNAGTITARGGDGIEAGSNTNSVSVTNTGSISATRANGSPSDGPPSGVGILVRTGQMGGATGGQLASVTNSGSVTATGENAAGIDAGSSSTNVSVINKGTITVQGNGSKGIIGWTDTAGTATVNNSGSVTVNGSGSTGIQAEGTPIVNNNGTVAVYGEGSKAIQVNGSSGDGVSPGTLASLNNSGSATATGAHAIGAMVAGQGGGLDVKSSGTIAARGPDSYGLVAVDQGTGNIAINLLRGSVTQGGTGSKTFDLSGGGYGGPALWGAAGIAIAGGGGTTLTNAGTISSGNGQAITVVDGAYTVGTDPNGDPQTMTFFGANTAITNTSTGSILGDITLGRGDDTIANAGTISGNIDMGGGINSLRNTGTFLSKDYVLLGAGNTFTNTGTLSPGGSNAIQQTLIVGNYTQTSPGKLLIDVDPKTVRSDAIGVTGNVSLGGTVVPNLMNPVAPSSSYSFVIVRGLTSLTSSVPQPTVNSTVGYTMKLSTEPNTAALGIYTAGVNSRDVVLTIAPKPMLGVVSLASSAGGLNPGQSANLRPLGTALTNAENTGGLTGLTMALRMAPDSQTAATMLKQMLPVDQAAQIFSITSSSLGFNSAMRNCAAGTGGKAPDTGCTWGHYSFGVQPQAELAARLGMAGDSLQSAPSPSRHALANPGSAAYGSGMQFGSGMSLSFASSYETVGFGSSNGWAGAGASQGERAIFGSVLKKESGPWQVSLNAISSYGWYDNSRATGFGTAYSGQDASSALTGIRIAYQDDIGPWYIRPLADLNATYLRLGGYTESGAGIADLTVAPAEKWLFSIAPGVEAGASFTGGGWTLKPYARAGVSFANSDSVGVLANFAAAPSAGNFSVASRLDSVMADVQAGVNFVTVNGIAARLNYEGHVGNITENHIGGLKMQLPF